MINHITHANNEVEYNHNYNDVGTKIKLELC